jgi:hypothetical protein
MRHLKPREIQGCQLALDASIPGSLYDATSGGSLVAADGVVKRWEDQSGNGYNVTEATNGPQRKVATMNGVDTLYFDGTNDRLSQSAASQSKFLHVAAGATFAAVAHFGTSSDPNAVYVVIDNHGTSSTNIGASVVYDDRASMPANNRVSALVARGVTGPFAINATSRSNPLSSQDDKITPNAPVALTVALDNGNATAVNRQRIAVNGAPEFGNNDLTNAASAADPTTALNIGFVSTLFMLGYISEINGWNRVVGEAVRKRISNSRQRKWRING